MAFSSRWVLIWSGALFPVIIWIIVAEACPFRMPIFVGSFVVLAPLLSHSAFNLAPSRILANRLALPLTTFAQILSCSWKRFFPCLLGQNLEKSNDSRYFLVYCLAKLMDIDFLRFHITLGHPLEHFQNAGHTSAWNLLHSSDFHTQNRSDSTLCCSFDS